MPVSPKQKKYSEGFELFWEKYPRRVEKKKAYAVWLKIKPSEDLLKLMLDALDAQIPVQPNLKFWRYPERWLNEEKWTDEVVDHSIISHDAFMKKMGLTAEGKIL